MGLTDEKKDLIFSQVEMADVLVALGFEREERHKALWNKFSKGDTTLVVKSEPHKKQLYFNSKDDKDKGDIIDLVIHHNSMNFRQAQKYLLGFTNEGTATVSSGKRFDQPVVSELRLEDYKFRELGYSDMLNGRGLHGVYKSEMFDGTVCLGAHSPADPAVKPMLSGKENLCFISRPIGQEKVVSMEFRYWDIKSEILNSPDRDQIGREEVQMVQNLYEARGHYRKQLSHFGTEPKTLYQTASGELLRLSHKNAKVQAAGSKKSEGFWMSNKPVDCKGYFVVESPIDAMSHYKMYVERFGEAPPIQYLSTAGTISARQIYQLKEAAKDKLPLFLGFDNDFAGYRYAARVIEAFSDGKVKVLVEEEELKIDATFFNLGVSSFKKNEPRLHDNFKAFFSKITQSGAFPHVLGAFPHRNDFNEDLTFFLRTCLPVVYDFDNTIGGIDNLRNLVGEEQVKKKEQSNTFNQSITKTNFEMEKEYKHTVEEVDSVLKKYGQSVKNLRSDQIESLRLGRGTLVREFVPNKEDAKKATYDAKIWIKGEGTGANKRLSAEMNFYEEKLYVSDTILGNKITPEMKDELLKTGFLYLPDCKRQDATGKIANLGPVLVAVDPDVNRLTFGYLKNFNPRPNLKGATLSPVDQQALKQGQAVQVTIGGKVLEARWDPSKRSIGFWDEKSKAEYLKKLENVPVASDQEVQARIEKAKQAKGQQSQAAGQNQKPAILENKPVFEDTATKNTKAKSKGIRQ